MTALCFECYQQTVYIQADDPLVLALLPRYLPPGARLIGGAPPNPGVRLRVDTLPDATYRVRRGRRVLGSAPDAERVCEGLEGEIALHLAEHCPDRVFVHAGVVAWQGQAIVIPGRSYSGKSSLVAALIEAGATYASDEFAPIDADGRVHPYPRALKLRWPYRACDERMTAPSTCATSPLPVGLVIATRFTPNASWTPRCMAWGEAMLALLANTVPARRRPAQVLPSLRAALAQAQALEGPRGEAADTARRILDRAARGSAGGRVNPP